MKRNRKTNNDRTRLSLSRTTVRKLDSNDLGEVAGASTRSIYWTAYCTMTIK